MPQAVGNIYHLTPFPITVLLESLVGGPRQLPPEQRGRVAAHWWRGADPQSPHQKMGVGAEIDDLRKARE